MRPEERANAVPVPSDDRITEVGEIIDLVTRWAARQGDVVALLLVGSYARGAAGPDSDIDLVLLTNDEARYSRDAWARRLGFDDPIRVRSWGPISERRYVTASGLEVEIGIGTPDWAGVDPVDPGTRRVVSDGARSLHDPTGLLGRLLRACRPAGD
jgi:uncharacterized protein